MKQTQGIRNCLHLIYLHVTMSLIGKTWQDSELFVINFELNRNRNRLKAKDRKCHYIVFLLNLKINPIYHY